MTCDVPLGDISLTGDAIHISITIICCYYYYASKNEHDYYDDYNCDYDYSIIIQPVSDENAVKL